MLVREESEFKGFSGVLGLVLRFSGKREVLGKISGKLSGILQGVTLIYFARVFPCLNPPEYLNSLRILKILRLKYLKILEVVAP